MNERLRNHRYKVRYNIYMAIRKIPVADTALKVSIQKKQKRFKKIKNPNGPDIGVAEFFLLLDVTAFTETIYIPLSIASGKKPTGFVYQIEGTAKGDISTTDISCKGPGVTQVTLGTILYSKIPAGKKATFRILIEIRGRMQNTYSVVINRINYKRDMAATRYEKLLGEIRSDTLRLN